MTFRLVSRRHWRQQRDLVLVQYTSPCAPSMCIPCNNKNIRNCLDCFLEQRKFISKQKPFQVHFISKSSQGVRKVGPFMRLGFFPENAFLWVFSESGNNSDFSVGNGVRVKKERLRCVLARGLRMTDAKPKKVCENWMRFGQPCKGGHVKASTRASPS